MKKNQKKLFVTVSLLLLNYLIFFNYRLFLSLFVIFVVFKIINNYQLSKYDNHLLNLIPISYFISAFVKTFTENPKSSIFWDMQNFLHYLSCNNSQIDYKYMFDNNIKTCPRSIGYGPLTELIPFKYSLIWESTIFLFLIFGVFIITLIYKNNEKKIILISILISPAVHFLIFSLNTDMFVLIYLFYLITKKDTTFKLSNFIFLSFLTQVKIYTFALFIGYIFLYYLKKDFKSLKFSIMFLSINLLSIIYHYVFQAMPIPEPISYTRSFGILHDFILVNEFIGFDRLIYLLIPFLIFLLIARSKINEISLNLNFSIDEKNIEKILLILPLILVINTYQNWGYKFTFSLYLMFLIFDFVNRNLKIFLFLTTMFSTTYYVIGWGYENTILNLSLIIFSKFLFYSFYLFTVTLLFKIINNLNQRN